MYPTNSLRNITIDNAMTTHVFLIDIDFMPSYGIHGYLLDILNTRNLTQKEVRKLEVYFHTFSYATGGEIAQSVASLSATRAVRLCTWLDLLVTDR